MFKNLAGQDGNKTIREELTRCRIRIIESENQIQGEVETNLYGKLLGFTFKRLWCYYLVDCLLPIEIARELYKNPVATTDIRATGNACAKHPDNYVTYFNKEGKKLQNISSLHEWDKVINISEAMKKRVHNEFEFVKNPEEGEGFIEGYHIDSELGLYVFAQKIKKYRAKLVSK